MPISTASSKRVSATMNWLPFQSAKARHTHLFRRYVLLVQQLRRLEGEREVCENTECIGDRCAEDLQRREQNGDETDIDCGGSCGGCAPGGTCLRDRDCLSERCSGGTCAEASCTDGIINGTETDTDCGGDTQLLRSRRYLRRGQ